MELYSTNLQAPNSTLREAVFRGLPPDNGLYMPLDTKPLPPAFWEKAAKLSFAELASAVAGHLIGGEVPYAKLREIVEDTLAFDAPLEFIERNIYALELFHGPTLAFKDFGARFMSRLMSYFMAGAPRAIHILVATSGDTGSAVAKGFLGVPNTRVTILYPSGKVSLIQEKQLTTNGQNVEALEVDGSFDDCQRMVKQAFLDEELAATMALTSANSINISRLIPQMFYYLWAYAKLQHQGRPLVFCVPSGNFGNLCGGLLAHTLGMPAEHFVVATNANSVVPDFLATGRYDPRPSVQTVANAMDVGNPSNFPRMMALIPGGHLAVKDKIMGFSYSDKQLIKAVATVEKEHGYLMCPHTAAAYLGIKDYFERKNSHALGVFLSTAHPAKFKDIVERATGKPVSIPPQLQEAMAKNKVSLKMPADFQALKNHLLGTNP